MNQGQERRDQQLQHRLDHLGWIAPRRTVAGDEIGQQRDRFHLAERAARQHAAVIADEFAKRARQAGLAEQAARLALGKQQSGRHDRAPARQRVRLVLGLAVVAVEPPRRVFERGKRADAKLFVSARQDKGGADQPAEQAVPRVSDLPRDALAGLSVGIEPQRQHAFSGLRALRARRTGVEIAQPGEAVQHALERWRQLGHRREIDLRDRDLDPVDEEVPRAQRRSGNGIALQRAFDRRQHARLDRLAKWRDQRVARHAKPIGETEQAVAGGHRGRIEICQSQRAAGLDQFGPDERRILDQRLAPVILERNGHRVRAFARFLVDGARAGHEAIASRDLRHASPRSAAMLAA